jgi:hypothetical protein
MLRTVKRPARILRRLVLAAALLAPAARADAPLLALDLSSAYVDAPAVRHAAASGLDEQTCAALADAALASDVRLAVAQAASRAPAAREAPPVAFLRCLAARHARGIEVLSAAELAAHERFTLGYLLAVSREAPLGTLEAHEPGLASSPLAAADAIAWLEQAAAAAPGDFTVALVLALARGNRIMQKDFCQVWREVQAVTDRGLEPNLRQPVLENVLAYIDLYRQDCDEQEALARASRREPLRSVKTSNTARMSFDAAGRIAGASRDETALRIFSAGDGAVLKVLDTGQFTERPRWLDGGRWLAFADWKPSVRVLDGQSFAERFARDLPARATGLALVHEPTAAKTRPLLALGLFDGSVHLLDFDTGKTVRSFQAHEEGYVSSIVQQGQNLVTGGFDGTIRVFDLWGRPLARKAWTGGAFVQPAGDAEVLVRDFGDRWSVLEPLTGRVSVGPVRLGATLHDVALSPSRPLVAAALSSGVVTLFDRTNGRELLHLAAHADQVLSVDFSADGELMLTGSMDGSFRLWRLDTLFEPG